MIHMDRTNIFMDMTYFFLAKNKINMSVIFFDISASKKSIP